MKVLPDILADHILPFDWDVRRVWTQEEAEVSRWPIADLAYLLDLPLWSSVPGRGMLFDISPREVLASPDRSPHQLLRVLQADVAFPIDLLRYQERHRILDGVHRLAKLALGGEHFVNVRVHSEAIIPRIIVD
jgi:hypothetical protein